MDRPRQTPRNKRRWLLVAAGILLASAAVWGAIRLAPAGPTVRAKSVVLAEVDRGELTREVRGPGTLVAEQIRWVPSIVSGRVERRLVLPGARVQANTVLVELSNPELELELLEAQSQLASAEAALVNLKTSLATRNLEQRAVVASSEARLAEAERTAETADRLEPEGLVSSLEATNQRELTHDLRAQLEIAKERFEIFAASTPAEVSVQTQQVDRLKQVVAARRARINALQIVAGMEGVLQDISLEEGQWVQPGVTVARVIQPDRLKAVLRIPQLQAKDVAIGQDVMIDTRAEKIAGRVSRLDPTVRDGVVQVDVTLLDDLPAGSRPDLAVDGLIEVEQIDDVLHVALPAMARSFSESSVFRVEPDGTAQRVAVRYGRASVRRIEVIEGLAQGDQIVLSDTAEWRDHDAIRLR